MAQHRYPIHIRFNDLDSYGIVNNATYLTYFEEGRMRWFQDRVDTHWNWQEQGVLVARHEIDYMQPLRLLEKAEIELHIAKWGQKSFEVHYTIYKWSEGAWVACTKGLTVMVCYDYHNLKTIPIPEDWVDLFERVEG